MNTPIDTAAALYREIRKRGLHLRNGNGRDNSLIIDLGQKLGCPDHRLQAYLNASGLTAEAFLLAFMEIAAPFARMFQEIWEYLSTWSAPKALETISVRFGFPESPKRQNLTLEQFRRHVETGKKILGLGWLSLWPGEAMHTLFDLARILPQPSQAPAYQKQRRYEPGRPYALPHVDKGPHLFDLVVERVRNLFQHIIDGYAEEQSQHSREREIPELREGNDHGEEESAFRNAAYLLTDLLPAWLGLFEGIAHLPISLKDKAAQYFDGEISPLLETGRRERMMPVVTALDILDLPFWRHRWHTYEMWSTVLCLRAMEDYRPRLRIVDGYLPIDGYSGTIIADLKTKVYSKACISVQVETPFRRLLRKAIKPDLRICLCDEAAPEATATLIEFKQRAKLTGKYLESLANDYLDGSPRSSGLIFLNYDDLKVSPRLPRNAMILEGVRPENDLRKKQFREELLRLVVLAGLEPERVVVLLDVSSSMGDRYSPTSVQMALRKLVKMPGITILRFNDGLVSGGDLDESEVPSIQTSGGTQLRRALDEMEQRFGTPTKLLIITDGGHDHPKDRLSHIQYVRECSPTDVEWNIDWLEHWELEEDSDGS